MPKPAKNTICLWYNGDAEEAARFYAKTFPDSSVDAVHRALGACAALATSACIARRRLTS